MSISFHLHYKGDMFICLSVCLLPMAGRTAGPIKTKLGIGTHVDPWSVIVKVKVMWCHLVNANKTADRGLQGPREFERDKYGGQMPAGPRIEHTVRKISCQEDGYLQLVLDITVSEMNKTE